MLERPWSGETLKKLSRHLRDGTPVASGLPSYDEVMLWYDELVDYVITEIDSLPWAAVLGDRYCKPTGRAKTVQTLCQKLQRMPTTHLPSIQDIAGVRLEMSMSLTEQDIVAKRIAKLFQQESPGSIVDLRATAHSGYRAVHVLLNLPDLRGRAEVQIRTQLQGEWANTYEELADLVGRDIRYGQLPDDDPRLPLIIELQTMSVETIHDLETASNSLYLRNYLLDNKLSADAEESLAASRAAVQNTAEETRELTKTTTVLESNLVGALQSIRAKLREIAAEVRE